MPALDVADALARIAAVDPSALLFGTDLPSTRARRPFRDADLELLQAVLDPDAARMATWENAVRLYQPPGSGVVGART